MAKPGQRCREVWRSEDGQLVQERVCRRVWGGKRVKVVVWRQRLGEKQVARGACGVCGQREWVCEAGGRGQGRQ